MIKSIFGDGFRPYTLNLHLSFGIISENLSVHEVFYISYGVINIFWWYMIYHMWYFSYGDNLWVTVSHLPIIKQFFGVYKLEPLRGHSVRNDYISLKEPKALKIASQARVSVLIPKWKNLIEFIYLKTGTSTSIKILVSLCGQKNVDLLSFVATQNYSADQIKS